MKKIVGILSIGVLVGLFIVSSTSPGYTIPYSLEIVNPNGKVAPTAYAVNPKVPSAIPPENARAAWSESLISPTTYMAWAQAYAYSYKSEGGNTAYEYSAEVTGSETPYFNIGLRLLGDPGGLVKVNLSTCIRYTVTADVDGTGLFGAGKGDATAAVAAFVNFIAPDSSEITLMNHRPDAWTVDEAGIDINDELRTEFKQWGATYLRVGEVFYVKSYLTAYARSFVEYWAGTEAMVNAYDNDYGLHIKVSVVPVPEPGTLLLVGSGLMGLLAFRRKFRI